MKYILLCSFLATACGANDLHLEKFESLSAKYQPGASTDRIMNGHSHETTHQDLFHDALAHVANGNHTHHIPAHDSLDGTSSLQLQIATVALLGIIAYMLKVLHQKGYRCNTDTVVAYLKRCGVTIKDSDVQYDLIKRYMKNVQ